MDGPAFLGPKTVVLAILLIYGALRVCFNRRKRLPPGPPPDLFIGNLRHMPSVHQEQAFAEWGKIYGDIIYAEVFGKSLVVLNSLEVARDLLEKRSSNYSDRPRFVLLSELMGWDAVLTHMSYGKRFRRHRRLIEKQLHRDVLSAYETAQEQETCTLLSDLYSSPSDFMQHLRRWAASSVLKMTYGHTVKDTNDIYVQQAFDVGTATVRSGSPGSTLVDIVPLLKHMPTWLPGAGFKRNALSIRRRLNIMLSAPFEEVKRRMAEGTASSCYTTSLLEETPKGCSRYEYEDDIRGSAGVMYSAASDTSICIISSFLLAMTIHPDAYARAQAEIDRVVGTNRLPIFSDREALPYLECLLMEVYRWNTPVPLAVPHASMKPDEYRSYEIPAGTMVIPNVWAMMNDPQVYDKPHLFLPERFLRSDGSVSRDNDPRDAVFGFGRRICPGKDLADRNIWLAAANVCAAFDIGKVRNAEGHEVTPLAVFEDGFVSHPKEFKCLIEPRSDRTKGLIRQASLQSGSS